MVVHLQRHSGDTRQQLLCWLSRDTMTPKSLISAHKKGVLFANAVEVNAHAGGRLGGYGRIGVNVEIQSSNHAQGFQIDWLPTTFQRGEQRDFPKYLACQR